MKLYKKLIAAAAISATSTLASAALIDFDFTTDGSLVGSGDSRYYTNTTDGVTLTVKGFENGFTDQEGVTRSSWAGLGVNSDGDWTGALDGTHGTEWLRFDLSTSADLTYVNFTKFGWKDDWNLVVDGVSIFNDNDDDPWYGNVGVNSWFAIGADHKSDRFRVKGLQISTSDSVSVPEPTSIALLGTGLLALGMFRRRKQDA